MGLFGSNRFLCRAMVGPFVRQWLTQSMARKNGNDSHSICYRESADHFPIPRLQHRDDRCFAVWRCSFVGLRLPLFFGMLATRVSLENLCAALSASFDWSVSRVPSLGKSRPHLRQGWMVASLGVRWWGPGWPLQPESTSRPSLSLAYFVIRPVRYVQRQV